jgi:hypothetical protein
MLLLAAVCLALIGAALAAEPASGAPARVAPKVADQFTPVEPGQVKLSGYLGQYPDKMVRERINTEGAVEKYLKPFEGAKDPRGWNAEHAGKWLAAASLG